MLENKKKQMTAATLMDEKQNNRLVWVFVILSIAIRLIFWFYTDRIWEDALITLNPARNFWDGFGLTHHVPEPRVYSFTSALSVMILIIGEGFGHAIAFDRIVSLCGAAFSVFFAAKILRCSNVGLLGQIVCLSYLSTDHLQIFFGMSGMETQVATAIALGVVYAALGKSEYIFGAAVGLAALARPEFFLIDLVFLCYALNKWGFRTWRAIAVAGMIYLPWFVFTWVYYGSPVPNTITVKSATYAAPNLAGMLSYLGNIWKQFAPFKEFWFIQHYPGPGFFPGMIVTLAALMALMGVVYAYQSRKSVLILTTVVCVGFLAYLVRFGVNTYFMWYLPPFTALMFLLIGGGIHKVSSINQSVAKIAGGMLIFGYAIHLPFTLSLDRTVQNDVEFGVRDKIGIFLDQVMGPNDSVFLEPLGYIGLRIRNREIYDNPGLGSKIAAEAIRGRGWGALTKLSPDFLVMRPSEVIAADQQNPGLMERYMKIASFHSDIGHSVSFGGMTYSVYDSDFAVYKKISL